jgi:hypothetical protein
MPALFAESRADAEAVLRTTLSERIATLPSLKKARLLLVWQENFDQPPPAHLRRDLMIPLLAYRMQEREYGGLSHAARRRLREIARSVSGGKRRAVGGSPKLKSGTRLIRSWQGEVHEVNVNDDGFSYRGREYGSLSKIARERLPAPSGPVRPSSEPAKRLHDG